MARLFEKIRQWFIRRKIPKSQKPLEPTPKSKVKIPFYMAKTQLGLKEIVGNKHNPKILEYHKKTGGFTSDEVPWCSSFVNWCCYNTGFERSGEANARSWLGVGRKVTDPMVGDVVILWREKKTGWKGHVGFYAGEKGKNILVLGGNQSNEVNYQYYPKSRLLGYRRLGKIR